MRNMMPGMPRVDREDLVERHRARLRVMKCPPPLLLRQRAQQSNPALMKAIEETERGLDERPVCIGKLCPERLVVGLDGWILLCESQAESYVAVHVAVDDMVDDLPDGPAIGPVRCVE